MRVVILFSLLSGLLSSVSALSIAIDLEGQDQTGSASELEFRSVHWPSTAGGLAAKRGGAPTNGELLRRGLTPNARPRKLYERKTSLEARINNPAPATASQAPGKAYIFDGCYSASVPVSSVSNSNTKSYNYPYTNDADNANICAGKQDIDNRGGTFLVLNVGSNAICYTSVKSVGNAQTCSAETYARYVGN